MGFGDDPMVENDQAVVQDNSDVTPCCVGRRRLVETFPVDFARDFEDI
jgi:hypothetical protein